jgi:hypothetical protein
MKNKTRKTTKTVQIKAKELKKCKLGQEFKINVITKPNTKSTPPSVENCSSRIKVPKSPRPSLETRIANVIKAIVPAMIAEALAPIIKRLDTIIKLNNLKTE